MNKFQVTFQLAEGKRSPPFEVEALGFKSAYTAAVRAWGGKSSEILEVLIARVAP